MGRRDGSGVGLTMSADTRSFSGSLPISNVENWEPKKEWIWNGCDRWKVLGRNTLTDWRVMRLGKKTQKHYIAVNRLNSSGD